MAILAFAINVVGSSLVDTETGEQGWLISLEEAASAPAKGDGIHSRRLSDAGPIIDIVKPVDGEVVPCQAELLIRGFCPKP